jgi:hypothetical protein
LFSVFILSVCSNKKSFGIRVLLYCH